MLYGLVLVVYMIVCVVLIFLVLIQSDKGGGLSGAIGGGLAGASSLLGTQDTANILTRGTTIFASAFMVLCIVLSLILSHGTAKKETSLMKKRAETQESYSPSSILENGLPNAEALPPAPDAGEEGAVSSEEAPAPGLLLPSETGQEDAAAE